MTTYQYIFSPLLPGTTYILILFFWGGGDATIRDALTITKKKIKTAGCI